MNTKSLKCAINCDKELSRYVLGVFPSDRIPTQIQTFPCGFILNTDPQNRPGNHWVAVYITSPGKGEFFYSLGRNPTFYYPLFSQKKYRVQQ